LSFGARAVLLCTAGCLLAQTHDDVSEIRIGAVPYIPIAANTFTAETRLVEIPVVVRDGRNHPVAGLTKADFTVYDSAKPRTIASFSAMQAVASPPASAQLQRRKRLVALVIDNLFVIPPEFCGAGLDLSPFFAAVTQMRAAAEDLFEGNLRSGDAVSLFGFWEGQILPFQSDATIFRQALDRMTVHTICADVDLKLQTLKDIEGFLAPLPGDRSILLTSHVLRGRIATVRQVIERALKYGIAFNTLDTGGVGSGFRNSVRDGVRNDVLQALAEGTGGAYLHNRNDFTRGMKELGLAPPVSYLLGIIPDQAEDGRYHALKVKTTAGLRYSVKARPGYYALDPKKTKPSPEAQLAEIVAGNENRQDVPVTFAVAPPKPEDPPEQLTVVLNIDVIHLPFQRANGRREQQLTMVAALSDDSGNFVTGAKGGIGLDLKETAYAALVKQGKPLSLEMKLGAPPGRYRLRTVLREDGTNRMTASSQAIELKVPPRADGVR